MPEFPKDLVPVSGPFRPAKIQGVAAGMGGHGPATCSLIEQGLLPPDLICGMTLALLARQPRRPRPSGERKASGVAGRVWVRERFTIHRPISVSDPWTVTGQTTGTYARKGRSYSTTASESRSSVGERFASNLTTGLFSYRIDPDLEDSSAGLAIQDTPSPDPDHATVSANPHLASLQALRVGQTFGGAEVPMTLAMMAARDTDAPDNPIHSDLSEAKKAGLERPIAGGSHVLAFALEAVMAELGVESLLYGTCIEVRWKAPTPDGSAIIATSTVEAVEADHVRLGAQVDLLGGPAALVATLVIPLTP